jgi:hypothetical protein
MNEAAAKNEPPQQSDKEEYDKLLPYIEMVRKGEGASKIANASDPTVEMGDDGEDKDLPSGPGL